MKQTDMELQAIRKKLQLLQAEPPAAESLALPWSPPASAKSPQAIAIETLKQRSRGHDQAASARIDALVSQEIYRLEIQANQINERSQQQAADIMALKRSAQQASVGLRRQGIHDHPQLAAITQFLDQYTSAAVPHIERASDGHFTLSYSTIDFHQAQQDAIETANVLRSRGRRPSHAALFSQPIAATAAASTTDLSTADLSTADPSTSTTSKTRSRPKKETTINQSLQHASHQFKTAIGKTLQKTAGALSHRQVNEFTWLDGTIWFSGAAIARIMLQSVASSYPALVTALMLGLVGIILFALYRVVIVKTTDYTLVYRLCISLMGVFLAGLF